MIYNSWDVVLVPFPFTDRNISKKRPALIINLPEYQISSSHVVLLMITSAKNSDWENDIIIEDLQSTGLPNDSVIRFKVFSLDEKFVLKKLGILTDIDRQKIKQGLNNFLV
jgi:mRNA interferase MazF